MLLANGYIRVDQAAASGLGYDATAAQYITQNAGTLFTATYSEYTHPLLYGNSDGSRTPEQNALPGAVPNPALGLAVVGVLVTPAILPALAAIPGAPILGVNGVLGSTAMASATGTGAISAGINAASQYIQNGSINPVDTAAAFGTGAAGSYGGLLWNVAVNAFGGAAATAIKNILYGGSDSIPMSALSGGALSSLGYGLGNLGASAFNSAIKPDINTAASWAIGGGWYSSGWNMLAPNSAGVVIGTMAGGMGQEVAGSAIQNLPSTDGQKK